MTRRIGEYNTKTAAPTIRSKLRDMVTSVAKVTVRSKRERPVVIVGAGGFGREVLWILQAAGRECAGFVDDGAPDRDLLGRLGIPFLGDLQALSEIDADYVIGIADGRTRAELADRLDTRGLAAACAIHPTAAIGPDVTWGPGFVCCAHVSITTNVRLGAHVHMNLNSTVGHDSMIGSFVTVNPGANISGNVSLSDGVMIGTNSAILQGRRVGQDAVIGAGAVVTGDIPGGTTAVGIPARALEARPR